MQTDLKFFRLRKAFLSTTLLIFTREVLSSTYSHIHTHTHTYIYIYICILRLCGTAQKSPFACNSAAHTCFHIFVYLKIKVFWNMTPLILAVTDVSENYAAPEMSSHPRTLNPHQQYVTTSRRFHFLPFFFCLFIYRPYLV